MKRESAKRNPIINADDVDGSSIPMLRAPINSSNPLNENYRTGVHAVDVKESVRSISGSCPCG